ncbi:hypothetical protein ElyMa_002338500 [Elysia marginata]|uniref:Peptidase S1 domain-containing protein n=1 Tax=Elysia marginata TaxID=1093978 RepID=A0AAV4G8A3_9GAST|nr:hypothetical protein ElyMa_002338500 [Elysia marginata]
MKTLEGRQMIKSRFYKDSCLMACVIHDAELGERIKSALDCWYYDEPTPQDFCNIGLVSPDINASHPIVIISHPHGQPKRITAGHAMHQDNTTKPVLKYDADTCPGSSGAPVIVFDRNLQEFRNPMFLSRVHCGGYVGPSTEQSGQFNVFQRLFNVLWGQETILDQYNYGHEWSGPEEFEDDLLNKKDS